MNAHALISVIIPTLGRPSLELAIKSALGQSGVTVEVLVCKGSFACDLSYLSSIFIDERIRIIELGQTATPNGNTARQNGVDCARGEFVALLDDDDAWEDTKLLTQLEVLRSKGANTFSATSAKCVFPDSREEIWPKRIPEAGESISDYLFIRNTFVNSRPFIQTSTIMARKSVFQTIPFDTDLEVHQDWDWLIRAQHQGFELAFINQPLTVYNIAPYNSTKDRTNATQSMEWIQNIRQLISTKAYAEFLAGVVSSRALKQRSLGLAIRSVVEAIRTRGLGLRGMVVSILRFLANVVQVPRKRVKND